MDKGYIAPEAALKKLRVAKGLGQAVYIYGATGYGKTELVRQYLSRRRCHYISCAEDAAGLMETAEAAQEAASHSSGKEKEAQPRPVMVVDDMHLLKNAEGRKAVLSLAGRSDIWLILICRSPIPAWLMTEIAFAAVGLQVRLDTLQGEIQTAAEVLASFEKDVREQGAVQLLPNIGALQCRLALYQGDKEAVSAWMGQAPDEDREFCIMERYRYLTKVRCYLSLGEYLKAQALLEKLRYYTEKCRRTYVRMEVCLLSAIAKYRTGGAWKEEFLSALKEACSYHFIRLISEEGAAAQELFAEAGKGLLEKEIPDREWLSRLTEETGKVAVRYPVYLKGQLAKAPDFCEVALSVLRLQAEGKSVGKIAQELSMKEATVKYHAKENYRKLGVSGKADAVLAARNLGIL